MNPPEKPNEADCCGSGCNPCIFDIYEKQLKLYLSSQNIPTSDESSTTNCICLTAYSIFRLVDIKNDSRDTYLYTFKHAPNNCKENKTDSLKLIYKPGQHFLLRGRSEKFTDNDNYFTRAYTPLYNKNLEPASFLVLIKLYENGLMSEYVKNLKISDETFWRGPYGDYDINYNFKYILMIAQGTGIAPIFTIINKLIENEECETFIHLFYCCRDVDTIHLRNEIYELCSFWNFKCDIFLSIGSEDSVKKKYNENVVFRKLNFCDIEAYFFNIKSNNLRVLICGRDTFNKQICEYVKKCNIDEKFIHIF